MSAREPTFSHLRPSLSPRVATIGATMAWVREYYAHEGVVLRFVETGHYLRQAETIAEADA